MSPRLSRPQTRVRRSKNLWPSLILVCLLLLVFRRHQDKQPPRFVEARRMPTPNDERSNLTRDGESNGNLATNRNINKTDSDYNKRLTIEIAVFIDLALSSKFTSLAELNKLVLTIMNQVQFLFRYNSLKYPISLKINLVEHLKDSKRNFELQPPDPERGNIDSYLNNFCKWQLTRLQREARIWWDHAILLSGLDLYKVTSNGNQSGVLGLSWVGGMCNGKFSCTVGEATHLESAFVIAHEIGHNLGMMHDGAKNRCDPNRYIMSDKTGAGKINWSACSNEYLDNAIRKNLLGCLKQEQSSISDQLYDLSKLKLAPGQVYNLNDQCRLAYGINYTRYMTSKPPYNDVCRELWCAAGSWALPVHPALEGSNCDPDPGVNRVCREGKCTDVE